MALSAAALFSVSAQAADLDAVYQPGAAPTQVYSEPVDVIALDALGSPGRQASLSAGLYRRGKKLFRTISDTQVSFTVAGSSAGTSESKKSGMAELPYLIGDSTGQYLISVSLTENDLFRGATGYALLAIVSQNFPLLLVDFDSALYKGLSGKFDLAGVERLKPMPGSAQALGSLQEKYQIVYLTEYEVTDLPKIRRWIHHWKMPKAPVLFWDRGERVLKNDGWKARELAQLLKRWNNVQAALAGSSASLEAFRASKLKTVGVRSKWTQEPGTESDWREVLKEIESK